MSAAACKTILCSADGEAAIHSFLTSLGDSKDTQSAASGAVIQLRAGRDVTLLLSQQHAIEWEAAEPLIDAIGELEQIAVTQTGNKPKAVAEFLTAKAAQVRQATEAMHLAVTGEPLNYE